MNSYSLKHDNSFFSRSFEISGSKSESNRLLILKSFYRNLEIENLSDSDDSLVLSKHLKNLSNNIDIGHAGTAMRFLTAFLSIQNNKEFEITGSRRMKQRPIKILVDALRSLGAEILYTKKDGFPPLQIRGKKLIKNNVKINGNISSQYISALLLIAASLPNGLRIQLLGDITSIPYIKMTLSLLNKVGVSTNFDGQYIHVKPYVNKKEQTLVVESDWSSASYFYSIIALSKIGSEIRLSSYSKESLQGDSVLAKIYLHFGVETSFKENSILLRKTKESSKDLLKIDLNKAPDIAQTIAVTCFGLGISCNLNGLHTLKIKETDRLEALHKELSKLGATISVTDDSLDLQASSKINSNISIETYNDHRMAMAFTPLAIKTQIQILDAGVVTKSYRNFWEDMQQIGFQLNKL